MDKHFWRSRIKDGMVAEYIRRHDEISDEMVAELRAAGICNYTILKIGNDLLGVYECAKGEKFALDYQAGSLVVREWEKSMDKIVTRLPDGEPIGKLHGLCECEVVFRLD